MPVALSAASLARDTQPRVIERVLEAPGSLAVFGGSTKAGDHTVELVDGRCWTSQMRDDLPHGLGQCAGTAAALLVDGLAQVLSKPLAPIAIVDDRNEQIGHLVDTAARQRGR